MAKGFGSFVMGVTVGAAATAAYYAWRAGQASPVLPELTPASAITGSSGSRSLAAVESDWNGNERTQLLDQLRARTNQLEESEHRLETMRAEITGNAATWQAKVPALVQLGQALANMPPYKTTAGDAAVAVAHLPVTTLSFQDLATVHGIGATYEQRLYRAGVGTYWELAHLTDEDFAQLLRLTDLQRRSFDSEAIRSEAKRLAVATNTVGLIWDGETPDDFEQIKGIGKVFEQRLYDAGIYTYRALAAATLEELAAVCQGHSAVAPDFADWIGQAQNLLAARG